MARPVSIDDATLIDALTGVISRHGYDGASLQLLSQASGLQRASLYHRFPGGKAEILEAALRRAEERFENMLAPASEIGPPRDRAERIAAGIDQYYDGGQESCLLVALSLADPQRRAMAAPCFGSWTVAFARIATDAGANNALAASLAEELVAQIEGALVIAAATGNRSAFQRVIRDLPGKLALEATT